MIANRLHYFLGITSFDDARDRYRRLSKNLHPDHGGTVEGFQAMQKEWESVKLCEEFSPGFWAQKHTERVRLDQEREEQERRLQEAQETALRHFSESVGKVAGYGAERLIQSFRERRKLKQIEQAERSVWDLFLGEGEE